MLAAGADSLDINRATKVSSCICHPDHLVREEFALVPDSFFKYVSKSLISQCDNKDCWKLAADSFVFLFLEE